MIEDRRQHSSFNEVDRTLFYQMAANIAAATREAGELGTPTRSE
jgi:hypothetical protein